MANLNGDQGTIETDSLSLPDESPSAILLEEPVEVFFRKLSTALEHQDRLDKHQDFLLGALEHGNPSHKELALACGQSKDDLASVREFLEACFDSTPMLMRSTANSAYRAEEVFGTPELVEVILLYLSPPDILRAVQVNRATSGAIASSPRLQKRLHLRHDMSSDLCTLFDKYNFRVANLIVRLRPKSSHRRSRPGNSNTGGDACPTKVIVYVTIEPKMDRDGRTKDLPSTGKLCRQMLLCQPPIKTIGVWPGCCNDGIRFYSRGWLAGVPKPDDLESINCETGITVGHVYDKAIEILSKHRYCPYASSYHHDADGLVNPRIFLGCEVDVDQHDPVVTKGIDGFSTMVEREKNSEIENYINAKILANSNGQPIPSLAQFREGNRQQPS